MEFFIFSIRPDNIYHGTLAFHFLTGNGSGEGVEEGAAHHQNRNDSQQQKQQGEEKAVVLTVRVQGGARPVIFEGVPPDGLVSAHVHCSLADFLYIYSGKASFSDVMRLGLKGAISVTGYKFAECSRFAQAFDLSSPQWVAFYASGQQGLLRREIIKVPPALSSLEEEDNHQTARCRRTGSSSRSSSVLLERGLTATAALDAGERRQQQKVGSVMVPLLPYALPEQMAFESGAWALGQQAQALLEEAAGAAAAQKGGMRRLFLSPLHSEQQAERPRQQRQPLPPSYQPFLLLPSAPDAATNPSPSAVLLKRAVDGAVRRVKAMRAGRSWDMYSLVRWAGEETEGGEAGGGEGGGGGGGGALARGSVLLFACPWSSDRSGDGSADRGVGGERRMPSLHPQPRRRRSGSFRGGAGEGGGPGQLPLPPPSQQQEVDFSDWWAMSRSMAAAAASSSTPATALTLTRFFSRA